MNISIANANDAIARIALTKLNVQINGIKSANIYLALNQILMGKKSKFFNKTTAYIENITHFIVRCQIISF